MTGLCSGLHHIHGCRHSRSQGASDCPSSKVGGHNVCMTGPRARLGQHGLPNGLQAGPVYR
jgi:hypothetical protein